jgi:hypothetical protein
MVDPSNITKYECSEFELQELILFWICVAGKKANTISRILENFLQEGFKKFGCSQPFDVILNYKDDLPQELKKHGIGCYNNKSKTMLELVKSNIDLKNCPVDDLESVYGIGMKTSRCFLLHSRKNAEYAGLDTHILKFMKILGYDVPKSTPTKNKYKKIEKDFLFLVKKSGFSAQDVDLLIWNYFSQGIVNNKFKTLLGSINTKESLIFLKDIGQKNEKLLARTEQD